MDNEVSVGSGVSAASWVPRLLLWLASVAVIITGIVVFNGPLGFFEGNSGGRLFDFPAEVLTATAGLALICIGLLMLTTALVVEALRAQRSNR